MALWIHGAAPDNCLFLILLKEGHGNYLYAPLLGRHYLAVNVVGLVGNAQHLGYVGTIYVHIQEPNLVTVLGQGCGQVYGHRCLAHSPLTAIDSYLGLDSGEPPR